MNERYWLSFYLSEADFGSNCSKKKYQVLQSRCLANPFNFASWLGERQLGIINQLLRAVSGETNLQLSKRIGKTIAKWDLTYCKCYDVRVHWGRGRRNMRLIQWWRGKRGMTCRPGDASPVRCVQKPSPPTPDTSSGRGMRSSPGSGSNHERITFRVIGRSLA